MTGDRDEDGRCEMDDVIRDVTITLTITLTGFKFLRQVASHHTFTSGNSLSILRCCFCLTSYYHNSLSLLDNKNL